MCNICVIYVYIYIYIFFYCYILYVIVDDFFGCNELRRFVSCFYPSQAVKIEDAMSRGNGAEMSVAKKFPATWPWCYRPKGTVSKLQNAKLWTSSTLKQRLQSSFKMEGNGTQPALKMLRRRLSHDTANHTAATKTLLVYDESSVAMGLETLPGLGLLSVLQTNKSLLCLAELGASLLGPGDDTVA